MDDGPTLAGFNVFVRTVMGINTTVLPVGTPAITYAYNVAIMITNPEIGAGIGVPTGSDWSIYALAVYNLAGDRLIRFAPDQSNQTYFATLRGPIADGGYGLNSFAAGVVQAASDEATSDSLAVPDALKQLSIMDLQMLKTPWGLQYLAFAQDTGTLWGMS
jgi:hypothetical protein